MSPASDEDGLVESPESKKLKVDDTTKESPPEALSSSSMQRYLVTVEYIGSRYFGFQKQKGQDARTVQGAIEEAFCKFVGKPVESSASSRTDTGVHALRNVCHVDVERISKRRPGEILPPHEPDVVKRAVNHFLQRNGEDVQVLDVQRVPRDFHARFQAKERTYHYRIIVTKDVMSVFEKERAWHVQELLDIEAMQKACKVLVGHHDFSSFRASGCQAKSPMKTLDELNVCEMPYWPCFPSQEERLNANVTTNDSQENSTVSRENAGLDKMHTDSTIHDARKPCCYVITARARSFLYHQVRLMVGLLKAVGAGALKVRDVQYILEAKDVTKVPPMAPACGLYLAEVKYDLDKQEGEHAKDDAHE